MSAKRRCSWAQDDPLLICYHDVEWGKPIRDNRELWETLVLDGFQAGLSWRTILQKRDAFRSAFKGFDPKVVARFKEKDVQRLMQDKGIVRSDAKVRAAIGNAQAYLDMMEKGEDFSTFVWALAGGAPKKGGGRRGHGVSKTPESEVMAKALKTRGFKFVGPVIVYAWMQAVGMVNDHEQGCFRRRELIQ